MVTRSDAVEISQRQDTPKIRCEGCKNHCIAIESLKTDLQSKDEKIMKLTSHAHKLETDHPTSNENRRYGDVGKDDMHEAMMQNSSDKDIIIGNLKKENQALTVEAKVAANPNIVAIESLKK